MSDKIRLVQLINPLGSRIVAQVQDDNLFLIQNFSSAYDLVMHALATDSSIAATVAANVGKAFGNYTEIWAGTEGWQWLPSFDHPHEPNACMVAGTGLTHKASAENRDKMNAAKEGGAQTDSMKMYFMGEEGGKPGEGKIGVQAEWFYKGNGSVLRGHGQGLEVPNYAMDGGEEPEIAGVYVIDRHGRPVRVGYTTGNEFSDHVMEKINYLYLAPSKIRTCAIGPELVIGETFQNLTGTVMVKRGDEVLFEKDIKTGEQNMAHSIENLEYHHFKYQNHRLPGQVHIHFFGTGAFSFGVGLKIENTDTMHVHWPAMGKALINPLQVDTTSKQLLTVKVLT